MAIETTMDALGHLAIKHPHPTAAEFRVLLEESDALLQSPSVALPDLFGPHRRHLAPGRLRHATCLALAGPTKQRRPHNMPISRLGNLPLCAGCFIPALLQLGHLRNRKEQDETGPYFTSVR